MNKVFIEFVYVINDIECRVQIPPNTPFDVALQLVDLFQDQIKSMKQEAIEKSEQKEGE